MYFKDKLDSINAYICISVYTGSGNIARIAAILPELLQYCQNSGNTNLHAKSSIRRNLRQYCKKLLLQYCRNILLEGLYFDKGRYSLLQHLDNQQNQTNLNFCFVIYDDETEIQIRLILLHFSINQNQLVSKQLIMEIL